MSCDNLMHNSGGANTIAPRRRGRRSGKQENLLRSRLTSGQRRLQYVTENNNNEETTHFHGLHIGGGAVPAEAMRVRVQEDHYEYKYPTNWAETNNITNEWQVYKYKDRPVLADLVFTMDSINTNLEEANIVNDIMLHVIVK